ncbi:MAG: HesA/MoeB/ThiF family protein [Parvularculaceae bacterium]
MLTKEQTERYARHIVLKEIGGQGQQKLLAARVLVIGAGGVGAPVIAYLAAAGAGTIGVVDDDNVALSNLQRQVIHTIEDIGYPKTESARAFAELLNPDVRVVEHRMRLGPGNAQALVAEYDLVIDGSDNFETRFAVNDACIAARKTLISAALGRFEGNVATFAPFAGSAEDALPCYRCFVPEAPAYVETCAQAGVLGAVAGVIGSIAAVEAVKEICGVGDSLAGRLLIYDALTAEFRTIGLPADPDCPACGALRREKEPSVA